MIVDEIRAVADVLNAASPAPGTDYPRVRASTLRREALRVTVVATLAAQGRIPDPEYLRMVAGLLFAASDDAVDRAGRVG